MFSRRRFIWPPLADCATVIAPSIDVFSPKNQELDPGAAEAILVRAGLREHAAGAAPRFLREDGTPALVSRHAAIVQERPLRPDERYVTQVSRWDRLKDPNGVIRGFAEHVDGDAHLVYAGPAVDDVADDPEGAEVLQEAKDLWNELPEGARARIHLATLPMEDLDENAAIVNALQRGATVVVQKSLAEGFGLTVAEAMWKGRPVVASRIGGIQDQIEDGESGVLLDDPEDLTAYGQAVSELLEDGERAKGIGEAARERVKDHYLGTESLLHYLKLIEPLLTDA